MADPAADHPRNLATPAAAAAHRQRSVLVHLLAAIEPADAEPLATRLLGEFRSLPRLWSQSRESIERITGKQSRVASLLFAVRDTMRETLRSELHDITISPSNAKLIDYLKASMGGLAEETLRVLFLDGAHRLIADEQIQHGTIAQLTIYPRVIFRRALELHSSAIILVHNHPSGDPTPSDNDLVVTERLIEIGRPLDIDIVAHLVVTAAAYRRISCRKHGTGPRAAARLFDLYSDKSASAAGSDPDDDERDIALANARRTVRRRLLRNQLLGADELFGEPAWDMLIDLFIHHCQGKPVATSELGIASDLSMSSALRLVQRLVDAELLVRDADPGDGRRNFISLAPHIAHRLTAFFASHDE